MRNRALVIATLEAVMREKPVAYWTDKLARGRSARAVRSTTLRACSQDAQVRHRGMRVEMQHPLAGVLPLVGSPLRLSATPVEYRLPPPLLGQHTDEVLSGLLGIQHDELDRLRQSGVV